MNEATNFKESLESSGRRDLLILASIFYVVLICLLYFALSSFFNAYLAGLVKSQNYSMAVQEWRQVANGITGGWTFSPGIERLCIFSNETLLYGLNDCLKPAGSFSGRVLTTSQNFFQVSVYLSYSIWVLSIFIPLLILFLVLGVYGVFKRPIKRKFESEILAFLRSFDQNQKDLSGFQSAFRQQTLEVIHLREQAAIANVAVQVAHDIRSPVSALDIVLGASSDLVNEKQVLAKAALSRIKEIADNLMSEYKAKATKSANDLESVELLPIIESIVAEKKLQLQHDSKVNIRIEKSDALNSYVGRVNPIELKRVISNLLNNSIEALKNKRGNIRVILSTEGQYYSIVIGDDGKGISPQLLSHLGASGVSFGKEADNGSGTGLGLAHAFRTVETWGGKIVIKSREGEGTSVMLLTPVSK